jgi:hypothetical protein
VDVAACDPGADASERSGRRPSQLLVDLAVAAVLAPSYGCPIGEEVDVRVG